VCPLTLPSRQAPFIRVFAGRCGFFEEDLSPYRVESAFVVLKLQDLPANMKPILKAGRVADTFAVVDGSIGIGEKLPCLDWFDQPGLGFSRLLSRWGSSDVA
jgi:hypothetical protein